MKLEQTPQGHPRVDLEHQKPTLEEVLLAQLYLQAKLSEPTLTLEQFAQRERERRQHERRV